MKRYSTPYQKSTHYGPAFVLFLIGIALTVALYYVKTRAQSAQSEALRLKAHIKQEQSAIDILNAEIAHLESPERLRELAQAELNLDPISTDQFLAPDQLAGKFELKSETKPEAGGAP